MNKKASIVTSLILAGIVMSLIAVFMYQVILPILFPARIPPVITNQLTTVTEAINSLEKNDFEIVYTNLRDDYTINVIVPSSLVGLDENKKDEYFNEDLKDKLISQINRKCDTFLCVCLGRKFPMEELIDCNNVNNDNIVEASIIFSVYPQKERSKLSEWNLEVKNGDLSIS
ncbi:hypothetical protein KY321_04755 [Candidatus Woesearchaeota archaeon]|nr:hypothetical protein [Candidatus Woesearchaeota archaeon]